MHGLHTKKSDLIFRFKGSHTNISMMTAHHAGIWVQLEVFSALTVGGVLPQSTGLQGAPPNSQHQLPEGSFRNRGP